VGFFPRGADGDPQEGGKPVLRSPGRREKVGGVIPCGGREGRTRPGEECGSFVKERGLLRTQEEKGCPRRPPERKSKVKFANAQGWKNVSQGGTHQKGIVGPKKKEVGKGLLGQPRKQGVPSIYVVSSQIQRRPIGGINCRR